MLVNESKVREKLGKAYDDMRRRARPKKWKSGPKKDKVKSFGVNELPFTRKQFVSYALAQFPPGGSMPCEYCVLIGKPANIIDVTTAVWDHKEPISHLKSEHDVPAILSLENLRPVCADCNNQKLGFTFKFYIGLMRAVYRWSIENGGDQRDVDLLCRCLRTHGVTIRGGFGRGIAKKTADKIASPQPVQIKLPDPW